MATTILGKVSVTPKGEYNAETEYHKLDIIAYNGGSYIVLKTVKGVLPSDVDPNYMMLAQGSSSKLLVVKITEDVENPDVYSKNETFANILEALKKHGTAIAILENSSTEENDEIILPHCLYDDSSIIFSGAYVNGSEISSKTVRIQSDETVIYTPFSFTVTDVTGDSDNALMTQKSISYALARKANIETVPVKTSDLENDNGFINVAAYPVVNETEVVKEITPNVLHKWGEVEVLNITLAPETEGKTNEYIFEFKSGNLPTQLTVPETVKWTDIPEIETNKTYQCSILNNIGVMCGA